MVNHPLHSQGMTSCPLNSMPLSQLLHMPSSCRVRSCAFELVDIQNNMPLGALKDKPAEACTFHLYPYSAKTKHVGGTCSSDLALPPSSSHNTRQNQKTSLVQQISFALYQHRCMDKLVLYKTQAHLACPSIIHAYSMPSHLPNTGKNKEGKRIRNILKYSSTSFVCLRKMGNLWY